MAKNNGACSCSMAGGRCTCGSEDACQDIPGDACVSSGGSAISKPNKPIRPQRRSQSRYSGYSPPPYTIAGGTKYGTLPTFVYNCDSNYLGETLEESPWWIFTKNKKCKSACGSSERAGWHDCMDACVAMEGMSKEKKEKNGFWKNLFGTPSAESCEEQCQGDGCLITMDCDECVNDCQAGKSKAGQFVQDEGGIFGMLDKLGGLIGKSRGWGQGGAASMSDADWRLREQEEKNKRLVWGIAIFVFILAIIGFVVFMNRKK